MKHLVVVVAYSQTDHRHILFKNSKSIEQAISKAKKMHPNAKQYWPGGVVDEIVE
jgi:hypothetical protein